MAYLLSENRHKDPLGYWQPYERYIDSVKDRMPPGALKLALSRDWYDFNVHSCPHDGWLEELRIIESDSASSLPRFNSAEVRLLGAYHDGFICLRYPRLISMNIQTLELAKGFGDWLYDEFRLSEKGNLLHEIEWASGARWLIESDDVEVLWQPFVNGSEV